MPKRRVCVGAALAVVITSVGPVSAQPASRVKVGTLARRWLPNVGYVVGSPLTCRFTPEVPRPPEVYVGAIRTAGLDIGVKTEVQCCGRSSHPSMDIIEGPLRGSTRD